jgi:hypothetical protein
MMACYILVQCSWDVERNGQFCSSARRTRKHTTLALVKFNAVCQQRQNKTACTSSSTASLYNLPAYISAVVASPIKQALHHYQKKPATVYKVYSLFLAATQSSICKSWRPRPLRATVQVQRSSPETPHAGRSPLSC